MPRVAAIAFVGVAALVLTAGAAACTDDGGVEDEVATDSAPDSAPEASDGLARGTGMGLDTGTGTGSTGSSPPDVGDHWHAAIGVNVCGEWLSNPPEFHRRAGTNQPAGIHSHGDGLIHLHPFTRDEAGENATVGTFFEFGGWELDDDSFHAWEGGEVRTGDKCDGRRAGVRWAVNGEEPDGDPGDYRPRDGDVIAIAVLPAGERIGRPPSARDLASPRTGA